MAFGGTAGRAARSARLLLGRERRPAETSASSDTGQEAADSPIARWQALAGTTSSALGRTLGTAVAVGALAGAGQMGIAYGLGLLHYPVPASLGVAGPPLTDGVWASQLTWIAWFAALAVLGGAASANWMARRQTRGLAPGGRAAVTLAAAIGGAVVMPLAALPARSALLVNRAEAAEPALDAALAAGLGLVVGILAAFAALSVRLVAVSLTLLVAVAWFLALVSVAPSLGPAADLPHVRLGVLDLPALGDARSTVAVLSAPLLALLVCGGIAWAARSRGLPPLQTAVSSAAAPGLLALAYLIGSPGTGERASQVSAYAGALIALAAGLLVALLVGAVRLPSTSDAEEAPEGGAPGDDQTGFVPPVSPASPAPASPPPAAVSPAAPPPWPAPSLFPSDGSEPTGLTERDEPRAPSFPPDEPPGITEPVRSYESLFSPPRPDLFPPSRPEPFPPSQPGPADSFPAEPAEPAAASFPEYFQPSPLPAPSTEEEAPAGATGDATAPSGSPEPSPEPRRRRLPGLGRRRRSTDEPAASEPLPEPAPLIPPPELPAPPLPAPPATASEPPRPRRRRRSTEEPVASEAPPDDPAPLTPTSELPAVPPTETRTRPKPRRLGRKRRSTDEPASAEPLPDAAAPESSEPTSPAAPESPAATPRPKRRGEVEHVDWISSLADRSEAEPEPEEKPRRRLRRDQDLGAPVDVPEPPTWPANDSPGRR